MHKINNFRVKLTPTLNRAVTFTSYPVGKKVDFATLYNKKTSALQFQIDTFSGVLRSKKIQISMYRNLEKCKFCQTFFNLVSERNDKIDFRCKFDGVNENFENDLFRFSSEKLDFQAGNSNHPSKNYLLVLGWKLFGLEDDLIFYFVQRRCYNLVTKSNIIRTAGLQFATKEGLDSLNNYWENRPMREGEDEVVEEVIDDINVPDTVDLE